MSYELRSARFLAREVLDRIICPGDTVVDATMGNGHDTKYLCELVGESGHVTAFDVQEQAVRATAERLREAGLENRAELILAGHENMAEYVKEPVRTVVFNLGWLPGGDHCITTRWETTRKAVEASLALLEAGGITVICVYPGHAEGERERQALIALLGELDNRRFNVLEQRFLNAGAGAPECFVIQKLKQV